MDTGYLSPNDAVLLTGPDVLGAVDIGNTLSEIPLGVGGAIDILQCQEGSRRVLVTLASLIAEMAGFDVQSRERLLGWMKFLPWA